MIVGVMPNFWQTNYVQMDNLNVDRAILIKRSRLRMPESGMNGPWHGKGSHNVGKQGVPAPPGGGSLEVMD